MCCLLAWIIVASQVPTLGENAAFPHSGTVANLVLDGIGDVRGVATSSWESVASDSNCEYISSSEDAGGTGLMGPLGTSASINS